jgi:segregation and condensation protein A
MDDVKKMIVDPDKFVSDLIFQDDDVTWQAVIYELAREGKIDPWDIDIAILSQEYLGMLKKLKEMNFRLSGKVILAAAVLLKMKAERIGLEQLFMLLHPEDYQQAENEDDGFDLEREKHFTKAKLDTRIPLPRKRKVTIFELVEALKKAVDVDERRRQRWADLNPPAVPHMEIKRVDIFSKIEALFSKLRDIVRKLKRNVIGFEEILPSNEKRDIIWTLLPLLHLANQGKLELQQDEPFGRILIKTSEEELNRTLTKEEFEKRKKEGEDAEEKESAGESGEPEPATRAARKPNSRRRQA